MAGPLWLAGGLAAAMIMIALYCAGRLAVLPFRQRDSEVDADALHVVMGVAMAGMFVPWLSPLPGGAWEAVFAAAAAWFAGQAIRTRRGKARAGRLCRHPVPHLIECIAMVYMLLAASGARPARTVTGMAMPGMGGSAGAVGSFPGLAAVLALFMIGYVVWAADQLSALTRGRLTPAARSLAPDPSSARGTPGMHSVADARRGAAAQVSLTGATLTRPGIAAGKPVLAPRLAACYKIAMSLTMGYMLVLLL